jgi:hypothetical protein
MDTLSPAARTIRVFAALLGAVLLFAGTAWGTDDNFPFGPFSMYAGVNRPDDDAPDTRVEGVDTTGAVVDLGQRTTGIRRAEIEGQEQRYRSEPELLRNVASAYENLHPDAPALVEVRIVIRWHGIEDSRPTGTHRDEVIATWRRP